MFGMQALEPGLMFAGRYRLLELLGSGGMSQVWRAQDQVLGRLVAVKVLSAELVRDEITRGLLRREARAMAMVSDPHVANIHDYGEYDADGVVLPFVVMELVHGQTLARALRHGPMPWPQAMTVAAQVASALAAAHAHGVVHCDVTPANVVLTGGGVKVIDFGIATVLGASRVEAEPRFGTRGYLAPERYDPQAPITPAADVYALGVLLFEALTGHRPDKADTPARLRAAVPELPGEVAEVCFRCLADDPAGRPGSAELAGAARTAASAVHNGLVEAGHRAVAPAPTRPAPTAILERVTRWPARANAAAWQRMLLITVAGLTIAVLTAVFLTTGQTPPEVFTGPGQPAPSPSTPAATPTPTPAAAATAAPSRGALASVANLRQLVVAGQSAGEIRPQCADSLLSRIADLQRRIDRGDNDNAQQRIEQIREEIEDRESDGDVTSARASSLQQALAAVII